MKNDTEEIFDPDLVHLQEIVLIHLVSESTVKFIQRSHFTTYSFYTDIFAAV